MPWSTWKRLVQKTKMGQFFSSYGKCLLLTSLKACDWSGHIFGASASPINKSFKKKSGYATSSMAVSMIPNM